MTDPAWTEVEKALRWSLKEGKPDQEGKAKMVDALTRGDMNFLELFRIGFFETQDHDKGENSKIAFRLCLNSDPRRLYNLGRAVLGLGPI